MKNISIAIDGPAGAGKSTIAKIVSKKLNIIYLDTGAMYRTFALFAIENGKDTKQGNELIPLLDTFDLQIDYSEGEQHVILNGRDVTGLIRTPAVSEGASNIAVIPEVRLKMVELQREIAKAYGVVMDGRDIGTYVLPDADLKIFLTASVDERAKRRYLEMLDKGNKDVNLESIKSEISYRDNNDSSRAFAPLKQAEDAVLVDTTNMEIEDVVKEIMKLAEELDV